MWGKLFCDNSDEMFVSLDSPKKSICRRDSLAAPTCTFACTVDPLTPRRFCWSNLFLHPRLAWEHSASPMMECRARGPLLRQHSKGECKASGHRRSLLCALELSALCRSPWRSRTAQRFLSDTPSHCDASYWTDPAVQLWRSQCRESGRNFSSSHEDRRTPVEKRGSPTAMQRARRFPFYLFTSTFLFMLSSGSDKSFVVTRGIASGSGEEEKWDWRNNRFRHQNEIEMRI